MYTLGFAITSGDVRAYDEFETAYCIANVKPVIRQGGLGL
jgi:hypothetical protein